MRRVLLLALLAVLGVSAPAAAETTPAGPGPRAVVVIGVAGLRWDDIGPATPALQALAARGAVGALSVKTPELITCPADGWLTLGAGARAKAYGVDRGPCTGQLPAPTADDVERNRDATDEAEIGLLARALGGLLAQGPGAALAAGPAPPTSAGPSVLVVDAGVLTRSRESLRAVDDAVAAAVAAAPADADVLVVGLSEGAGEDTAHLHVAIAAGPSFPTGSLRSASSRRDGYVQLIDVAPTVLALAQAPVPDEMDGEPWTRISADLSIADLVDLDTRAVEAKSATVPFFVILLVAQALIAAALWRRRRVVQGAMVGGIAALGGSYAAMLVPWWRAGVPLLALLGIAVLVAAPVTAAALRTKNPVGWVCGFVAVLLVCDLVTGARLQLESPAGYSSLVAGRFAGIGNVAFGVYGSCVLLATGALAAGRQRALAVVGACGLIAVAADGAPSWGSDVGGVLALLPAFLVLGMLLTGIRVSLLRLLLAGLAGAVVVTAFALVDHARPAAERSHLGRFVAQVQDGTAGDVLQRKAEAIGNLLFGNPVTALLPLVMVAVVYLFLRPPPPLAAAFAAEPDFRSALIAVGLMAGLGFALNDSGPAVVALAVVVVLPATLAVVSGVAGGQAVTSST